MPRQSETGNAKKICGCVAWKTCAHPWYVDYREGKEIGPDGKARARATQAAQAARRSRASGFCRCEGRGAARDRCVARRPRRAWIAAEDRKTLKQILDAYGQRPGGAVRNNAPIERAIINGKPFGEWPADAITREMLDMFRRQRPKVAANRDLALMRAAFNWAVLGGLVPATPFKVGTVAAVKLTREESRTRRLEPGEEEKLLLAANGLGDLIVAALETGCRLGELLSLQWSQVRGDLFLPAGKTKAKKPRRVPISTVLRPILDARRNDPNGDPLPADAFVFGDEVGRRRHSIKTAWRLTCKRAKIDGLHFHDLRREAGSRWMDMGVPLATIQRWLGHHNISQTSTYLAASGGGDADAMRAFEQASGRLPNVAVSEGSNGSEPIQSSNGTIEKTQSNVIVPEPVGVVM
jgi:integrase